MIGLRIHWTISENSTRDANRRCTVMLRACTASWRSRSKCSYVALTARMLQSNGATCCHATWRLAENEKKKKKERIRRGSREAEVRARRHRSQRIGKITRTCEIASEFRGKLRGQALRWSTRWEIWDTHRNVNTEEKYLKSLSGAKHSFALSRRRERSCLANNNERIEMLHRIG